MIRLKYWHKAPSETLLSALPLLNWHTAGSKSASGDTAALMLYVALIFSAELDTDLAGIVHQVSAASYDDLEHATALSRRLVADGLNRLVDLQLINRQGSHQKRRYRVTWPQVPKAGWFKIPCQAIVRNNQIMPFRNFTLRSKHELHALKLYLYLAARRNNASPYSMASYETIFESIGIPERDIRKAISLLIGTGLLRSVDRSHDMAINGFGPNKYFFMGCEKLVGYDGTHIAEAA